MQLLIKQRVFSWTDTYDVYDEKEEPKYFVKAEFFALGHQIHVYDKSGREVGMVKQRLLTLLPAFDIEIDGKEFGSVQKEFTFFKPRYELFYPQLGVKLCSMAGGGVQKIYMVLLREPSRRDRSGSDLFHIRDGFEIKMNFDRNVSCFILVNALMHDDFFD